MRQSVVNMEGDELKDLAQQEMSDNKHRVAFVRAVRLSLSVQDLVFMAAGARQKRSAARAKAL